MNQRVEKYGLGLDSLDAHTFKIMQIIDQEENNVKAKQHKKIREEMKNNG